VIVAQWLATQINRATQAHWSIGSPDRILNWLAPKLGVFYSMTAVCFWLIVAVAAATMVGLKGEQLWSELPSWNALGSPSNLIGFGVVFIVTRFFHELGHAVACKRAGATCREIGLIASYGMVCPYVDISDAWRIGDRYLRMGIALAGIYTEIIIASIAALIWCNSHPGWIHELSLQVALVCSVATLLFNANPLMKYDGYFVLCDWLNTQNLRERSFWAMDQLLESSPNRTETLAMSFGLTIYFIASSLNRLVMLFGIASMVYYVALQWQLAGLGLGMIVLYLLCNGVVSLAAWSQTQSSASESARRLSWLGWTAVGLLVSTAVNLPLPNRVQTTGNFQIGEQQAVYASMTGRISSNIQSDTAQAVQANTVLMVLQNDAINDSISELQTRKLQIDQKLTTLERLAFVDARVIDNIPLLQQQKRFLERQLEERNEELQRLKIVAPASGAFVSAMAKPPEKLENPLDIALGVQPNMTHAESNAWTDKPSIGRILERGSVVGWVVTNDLATVQCTLTEEQVAGVSIGSQVRIRLMQHPDWIWNGRVSELSKMSQASQLVETNNKNAQSVASVAYQLLIRVGEERDWSEYSNGNAEVVLLRPNQSLLHMATDQWFRNMRMR
jgi:putative peptide zinc metalloprotease protein